MENLNQFHSQPVLDTSVFTTLFQEILKKGRPY